MPVKTSWFILTDGDAILQVVEQYVLYSYIYVAFVLSRSMHHQSTDIVAMRAASTEAVEHQMARKGGGLNPQPFCNVANRPLVI